MVYTTNDKTLKFKWDIGEIMDGNIRYLIEDEKLTKDEAEVKTMNDPDICQIYWDDMLEYFTEIMAKIAKKYKYAFDWKITGVGLGWRSLTGYKNVYTENAKELLAAILPNTDCTFKVFVSRNTIIIHNWHHDCPVNPEVYLVKNRKANERGIE